ncbi:MAG: DUF222 domain-containing protein [Sporichthyaceae bacterium]
MPDAQWADFVTQTGLGDLARLREAAAGGLPREYPADDGLLWSHLPVGPELTAALLESEPEGEVAPAYDADSVDRIAAWARSAAFAQGHQLREVGAYAKAQIDARRPGHTEHQIQDGVAQEIALALHLDPGAAARMVNEALYLSYRLPATLQTLCRGEIDLVAVRILMSETTELTRAQCATLETELLKQAATFTPRRLRDRVRRAVLRLDPDAARRRHEQQHRDRHVELSAARDGMSYISAYLDARDAQVVFGIIDAHAKATSEPGDERTLDARRVDALVDLLVHPATGPRPQVRTEVRVVVPAGTLLGLGDDGGELPGHGPITAEMARRIATDTNATWRRILTDPADGTVLDYGTTRYRPPPALVERVLVRDETCRFPGCTRTGRNELDHVIPHRADGTGGATAEHNMITLCERHHRVKHLPGWQVELRSDGTVIWCTPAGIRRTTRTPHAERTGLRLNQRRPAGP